MGVLVLLLLAVAILQGVAYARCSRRCADATCRMEEWKGAAQLATKQLRAAKLEAINMCLSCPAFTPQARRRMIQ